jgi:hypothetical protein
MKRLKWRKKGIGMMIGLITILAGMIGSALAQGGKAATRQFEIDPLLQLDNPRAEWKVDLWVDRKDNTYKIGDQVTFYFMAERDCRVSLLNVATDGQVQVLFPNDFHQNNLVKAGTVYTIPPREAPFAIRAKAPAGEDVVKVIATLDNVNLIKEGDLVPVAGKPKGFRGIKKNLKALVIEMEATLKPVDPAKWAEAERVVKIVPAN